METGQTDSEFHSVALSESSRNLHHNFLTSPVPFECPDPILSNPLSSSTFHSVRPEPDSRILTPIQCQPRVSTPYPLIDAFTPGKDWLGQSSENRLFHSPWGFESTTHVGLHFQGGLLSSNSHASHQYAYPQSWHCAVTSPQKLSGQSYCGNDYWYPGDSSIMDGFGSVDERTDVIEQDSKVTSSTELDSSWKNELGLPPMADLLNSSNGKFERVSPVEVTVKEEKYQQSIQHCGMQVKPPTQGVTNEVRTQTPWKLKKPNNSTPLVQCLNKRKAKPRKLISALVYSHQKTVQRERERAIRDKIKCLSKILPWSELKSNRPSRKDILESAIRRIVQLQEDIREAYLQKGLKSEELKSALQGDMVLNLGNSYHQNNDASLAAGMESSLASTPELKVDAEDLSLTVASPVSELSSQGSEMSDSALSNGSRTGENTKHIKRPMNAFILFSKSHRTLFKQLYPGRDNRKISTLLAEKWRGMKPEEKEPYRLEAKELMRRTKESHPDFKYCDGVKKAPLLSANGGSTRQTSLERGYRVGSHNLRQRGANARDFKSTKRAQSQQEKTQTIQTNNSTAAPAFDVVPAATLVESKTVQTLVTPNTYLHHLDNDHSYVMQTLTSNEGRRSPVAKVNVDWHPSACDHWVQCEECKKWHMLPDETDPAVLPDKWSCSSNFFPGIAAKTNQLVA